MMRLAAMRFTTENKPFIKWLPVSKNVKQTLAQMCPDSE